MLYINSMSTNTDKKKRGRTPLPDGQKRTGRVAIRTYPDVEEKAKRLGSAAVEELIRNAPCVAVQVRLCDMSAAGKALKSAFVIESEQEGLCATTMLPMQWKAARLHLTGIAYKFDKTGTGDAYVAFNGADW